MCESLAEHIATEERMMIPPAESARASFKLIEWLGKAMRRLHDSLA